MPFILFSRGVPDYSDGLTAVLNSTSGTAGVDQTPASTRKLRFAKVGVQRVLKAGGTPPTLPSTATPEQVKAAQKELLEKNKVTLKGIQDFLATEPAVASYHVILNSDAESTSLTPVLLGSNDLPDITDAVIQALAR